MVPERIEREIVIEAPIDVVWAVLTEPEHVAGWFSDLAEIDLRPGGEATFDWREHGPARAWVERVERQALSPSLSPRCRRGAAQGQLDARRVHPRRRG